MILLEHDRPNCIGCGACVALYPQGWEMGDDGKSDIIGCTKRSDGWEEKEIGPEMKARHLEAAQSCPVNVIHLTEEGNQLI